MIPQLNTAFDADNVDSTIRGSNQSSNSFSVDTNGVYFIINNLVNDGICNIKPMFFGILNINQ